jgi:hypothetical protein
VRFRGDPEVHPKEQKEIKEQALQADDQVSAHEFQLNSLCTRIAAVGQTSDAMRNFTWLSLKHRMSMMSIDRWRYDEDVTEESLDEAFDTEQNARKALLSSVTALSLRPRPPRNRPVRLIRQKWKRVTAPISRWREKRRSAKDAST